MHTQEIAVVILKNKIYMFLSHLQKAISVIVALLHHPLEMREDADALLVSVLELQCTDV